MLLDYWNRLKSHVNRLYLAIAGTAVVGLGFVEFGEYAVALVAVLVCSAIIARALWPRAQTWPTKIGAAVTIALFFVLASAWVVAKRGDDPWTNFSKLVSPKLEKTIEVKLTPYIVVRRPPTKPGWKLASEYGFSAVLYVHNTTSGAKQVQTLEVSGDVEAGCQDYSLATGRFDGTQTVDEQNADCVAVHPYRRLHWVAHPEESGRVEGNEDERFIRFTFLKPQGFYRVSPGPESPDFFGSLSTKAKPKLTTTSVYILDLIKFNRVADSGTRSEMMGPQLRNELGGNSFFTVLINGTAVQIPGKQINRIGWTLEQDWKERSVANLFYGLEGSAFDRVSPSEPNQ